MFKLTMHNDKLTTTVIEDSYERVIEQLKVFKYHYGNPSFIQILLLNKNENEVDSN